MIGVLVVLFALLFFVRTLIAPVSAFITSPFYAARSWLFGGVGTIPEFFRDRKNLLAEIEGLKEKIGAASGNETTIALLDAENKALRTQIGDVVEDSRVLAGVIARPPFLPYDSILIDRGKDDGISNGNVVYAGGDFVIGRVVATYSKSSLVALLSTADIETTVFVVGPDIYTTAYGVGGGVTRVSVPQGIVLTKGDLVLMPALTRGILGTIDTIRSIPTEPEQDGYVTSHIPLQSLRFVTVGTREVEPITFDEARVQIDTLKKSLLTVEVPEGVLVLHATTSTSTLQVGSTTPTSTRIQR